MNVTNINSKNIAIILKVQGKYSLVQEFLIKLNSS